MSGIIGHVVLRAGQSDLSVEAEGVLVFSRQPFLWQPALHAFVQHRLPSEDDAIAFRSLTAGALLNLVADHV
eukprot:4149488-Prymnesium_polylepis.1